MMDKHEAQEVIGLVLASEPLVRRIISNKKQMRGCQAIEAAIHGIAATQANPGGLPLATLATNRC